MADAKNREKKERKGNKDYNDKAVHLMHIKLEKYAKICSDMI